MTHCFRSLTPAGFRPTFVQLEFCADRTASDPVSPVIACGMIDRATTFKRIAGRCPSLRCAQHTLMMCNRHRVAPNMRVNSLCKRPRWHFRAFCFAATLVGIASGCAESKPEVALVEGFVTFDGEPLADVEVVFLPDRERGTVGSRASALTDSQGFYALSYDRAGQIGTVPGYHRVCVKDSKVFAIYRVKRAGEEAPLCKCTGTRVPTQYASPKRTPLRVEVGPGRQILDLDIQPTDESE